MTPRLATNILNIKDRIQNQITQYVQSAIGRCSSSTFMLKLTHSLASKRHQYFHRWSPLPRANFFGRTVAGLPLKTMCSTKWEMPFPLHVFVARAGLDPNPDADRNGYVFISSVMRVSPLGQHLSPNVAVLRPWSYFHTPARIVGRYL